MNKARDVLLGALEFAQDFVNYARTSGPSDAVVRPGIRGKNLEAQLIKDYHRIEKGLSLAAPKRPFGDAVGRRLREFGSGAATPDLVGTDGHVPTALAALSAWNESGVVDETVAPFGPVLDPENAWPSDRRHFFSTRHSVRSFSPRPVTDEVLRAGVVDAMRAPSVCNRQAGRVRFYDGEMVDDILELQSGGKAFADSVHQLAVVSVERGLFTGAGERNQQWIDGGLFAMTLVWSLHGQGVGTCMLNWSKRNSWSRKLRKLLEVDDSEDFICVIALGYPAESYRVARSPRRSVREVAPNLGDQS